MCQHFRDSYCWRNNEQKQDCLANEQMTDNKNSFESTVQSTVISDTQENQKEPIRTQRTDDATDSLGHMSKATVASVLLKLGDEKCKQQGMQNCQQAGHFLSI